MNRLFSSNISYKPSYTSLLREDFSGNSMFLRDIKSNHKLTIRSMSPFEKGDSGEFKPDGYSINIDGMRTLEISLRNGLRMKVVIDRVKGIL